MGLHACDLVLKDFFDKQKNYEKRFSWLDEILFRVDSLEGDLKDKERELEVAERQAVDLTAKLKFADKNRYASKKTECAEW